jgi:LPXTG-site transpeptidase (sortase) family protein
VNPGELTAMDGVLYFYANDGVHGYEIWSYDPSSGNPPAILADIAPGSDHSFPRNFMAMDGVLYFSADDGVHGTELWAYDPSSGNPPAMVMDIYVGSSGSSPYYLTAMDGVLYFRAQAAGHGLELWAYDPRSGNPPAAVSDSVAGFRNLSPEYLTAMDGVLYFWANDGINGAELWAYDPSLGVDPIMVADINTGSGGSNPKNFVAMDGVLFFQADDGVNGEELWGYDPRSGNAPALVADINVGGSSSGPAELTAMNGVLYFSANDGINGLELWQLRVEEDVATVVAVDDKGEVAELPKVGFVGGSESDFGGAPYETDLARTGLMIEIPALDLDVGIVGVTKSGGGWQVDWLNADVGWLEGSAYPTWAGNTVLTGHVNDVNGFDGPFAKLKTLQFGDEVRIRVDELTYVYAVRENFVVGAEDVAAVFAPEEFDWVTLITCEGYDVLDNSFGLRRVVRAVLVAVE